MFAVQIIEMFLHIAFANEPVNIDDYANISYKVPKVILDLRYHAQLIKL